MKQISVYTSPGCGTCKNVIRFLTDAGVDVQVKDITENEEWFEEVIQYAKKCPVTVWNGKASIGYKPAELMAICEEWEYGSI